MFKYLNRLNLTKLNYHTFTDRARCTLRANRNNIS